MEILKNDKTFSRRDFLKATAAIGGAMLALGAASPKKASADATSPKEVAGGNPSRYGMLTDITRCIGCRRCEAACNKANNLPPPAVSFSDKSVFEKIRRTDVGVYTVVNRYANASTGEPVYRKVQCNHCAEPACASACVVGALKKSKEGPVLYNESLCIGCRYCLTACPFYIPTFEYFDPKTPAIHKCFLCNQRLQQGLQPACSTECPVEALTFGRRDELLKIARERIYSNPGRYIDRVYGEQEAGGTDWLYISGVPFESLGFPSLDTKPYPEYTREFLSGVPMVLVAFPALLSGFYLFSKSREQQAAKSEKGDKR